MKRKYSVANKNNKNNNKKKKLIIITGGLVAILIMSLIAVFIVCNSQGDNAITLDAEVQSKQSAEQTNNKSGESATEDNASDTGTSSDDSLNSTHQQSVQQTSGNTSNINDESNLPLCQRTHLSYEEAQRCSEEIRQRMDEENRKQQEEARAKWCTENMPQIYNSYNSRLLSENARYEKEVESYVSSYIASSGTTSENEAAIRKIAEKQYSPLHIQNVNSIVSQYLSTVQAHGCDTSGYNF